MQDFIQLLLSFLGQFVNKPVSNPVSIPPKAIKPATTVTQPFTTPVVTPVAVQSNILPKVCIHRLSTGVEGTPGKLTVANNAFTCHTLELEWLNNQHDVSCIPAGTYRCEVSYSNHMNKDLYHVLNVPDRTTVMIHNGNYAGQENKGLKSDVLGCILLGDSEGKINGQEVVLDSVVALTAFMKLMKNEPFEIEIVNQFEV